MNVGKNIRFGSNRSRSPNASKKAAAHKSSNSVASQFRLLNNTADYIGPIRNMAMQTGASMIKNLLKINPRTA